MLKTEMRNPKTMGIDKMSTKEMLKVIQEENVNAVNAVGDQLENIATAVDAIAEAFEDGGRLIYMGAGTSGRLAIADAAECPPTFGVAEDKVIGIIAGGKEAVFRANEKKEDDPDMGVNDLKAYNLSKNDIVVGISAAGGAQYVVRALEYAKSLGCKTIGITSNENTLVDKTADISIVPDTAAEVITGSTRMKAGTSQKLILNMLSTCAMIKSGYVYENLMINLHATNAKLEGRMKRIVSEILGVSDNDAENLLKKTEWDIKNAIELYKQNA